MYHSTHLIKRLYTQLGAVILGPEYQNGLHSRSHDMINEAHNVSGLMFHIRGYSYVHMGGGGKI